MVRQLLGNAGGAFSIQRFYGDLRSQGMPVAKDTLHAYLAHLQDAFLIRTIPIATDSERRRMVNPRKAYPIDPSLIPVFDRSGRSNLGHALETTVALELQRRGADFAYVRTKGNLEVDFVARYPGGREELIQVCADLDAPETRQREVNSLEEAAREHPRATRHVITLAAETVRDMPEGVTVHSAARWLLET